MKRTLWAGYLFILTGAMIINAAVISGTVSDSTGTPLKNIAVSLRTTTNALGVTIVRDTTDSLGAYSMSSDSTGKYTVRTIDAAVPPKYIAQYDTVALDGTDKTVTVKMAMIQKVTISGIVSDSASGTALSGVIVKLGTARADTTDADGKYSFDTVSSGTSSISVTTTGYVAKTTSVFVSTTALTADIKLVKQKYGSVTGIVSDSATSKPIPGAVVSFSSFAVGAFKTKSDTCDSNGSYLLDSIPVSAAKIAISATAPGSNTKTDSVAVDSTSAKTVNFTLGKIVYVTFSGKVTDSASGTPVSGAVVSFYVVTPPSTYKMRADTTDSLGAFSFDSLSMNGTLRYSTSATGFATKADSISITTAAPQTATITLVKTVYFAVSGKVTDSATGAVISGASIVLSQGMTKLDSVVTDANGLYTIDSAFSGAFMVITATGYTMKYSQIPAATANQTIDIALKSSVGVVQHSRTIRLNQSVTVTAGYLVLKNAAEAGVVRLFNVKGEMILGREFVAGGALRINFANKMPAGAYVVSIQQKTGVASKLITIR